MLEQAQVVAAKKRDLERSIREYESAHGLTPASKQPSRLCDVRNRGKNLNTEIARDGRPLGAASASSYSVLPVYDSPAKNLRAANAAAPELSNLSGDEWRRQQMRVNELVKAANAQQEQYRAKTGAGGSQLVRSAAGVAGRSVGQASSPHDRQRERSVNSSKNK